MSTSTLPKNGVSKMEDTDLQLEGEEKRQKEMLEDLKQESIEKYRYAVSATDSITARDLEEYVDSQSESNWQAFGPTTSEEISKKVRENIDRYIPDMIRTHLSLESKFYGSLSIAVQKKWISADSAKEWESRLTSTDSRHYEKADFIKDQFPVYLKNWEKVADDRKNTLDFAEKLGVTIKDVPALQDLLNDESFLSLHYLSKVDKVSKVKALVIAKEKQKEAFLSFIEKELESWSKKGWMHPSKVGPWMRRVMESDNPEQFAAKILYVFKNNWKEARDRFDAVAPAFTKRKDIRGFSPIKAEKFLLLEYDQRIAYLDEAESRLESDVNEEGKLAGLRLDIRHAMDTGDWAEAEELLGIAQGMSPDDKAVRSMGRYLALHRTDTVENGEDTIIEQANKGTESLVALRSIMQLLPANMRYMTEKALFSTNPNTLKRLWQIFYNRHWLIANGFSSVLQDKEESFKEKNYIDTRESIANGHGTEFARRTIKNETANDAGIRDECNKPQMVYTNSTGISEVYEGIERNANNEKFGYWTTLVDDEVPYELLREAVLNHMFHIKQHAKILRESGMVYSSYGPTFSVN